MDSLKAALRLAKHDTVKCNILNTMTEIENDDALWPAYNEEAFTIAKTHLKTESDTLLIKFYKSKLGACYINKGYYEQYVKENSAAALENYNKAVDILNSVNHLIGLASAYNNIGSVYENIGDVKKAIDYYNLSLSFKEKTGDSQAAALPLNNIGMIFHRQKDFTSAIKYYLRSIDISKRNQNAHGIAYASNNLGLTYQRMKNYKMAEAYFKIAVNNWEGSNNKRMLSYAYNNLGCLYNETGKPKEAREVLNKGYEIALSLNDKHVQAYTNLNYARIALLEHDANSAEAQALRALKLSKELAYPENIRDVSLVLYEIYAMKKNPEESLAMYELYIRMRDSLNNEETKKASIKSDLKYEFDKKAAADSVRVMEEKKLSAEKLNHEQTQRYALYGGLALLVLFALFMVNRFRVTSRQKDIISSQKKTVEIQKSIVEEKQKEILDSIHYARRIQLSLLPQEKYIDKILSKKEKL